MKMKILYYVPFLLVAACGKDGSDASAEVSPSGWNEGALTLDFKDAVISQPDGLWRRPEGDELLEKPVLQRDNPQLLVKELGGDVTLVAFRGPIWGGTEGKASEDVLGDGYKDVLQIVWMDNGQGMVYHFPPMEDPQPGTWRRVVIGGKVTKEGSAPVGEEKESPMLAPQTLKNVTFEFDDSHAISWDSTYFTYKGQDKSGYWHFWKCKPGRLESVHLGDTRAMAKCHARGDYAVELVYRHVAPNVAVLTSPDMSLDGSPMSPDEEDSVQDNEFWTQYLLIFTAPDRGVAVCSCGHWGVVSYVTNIVFTMTRDAEIE